MQVQIKYKHVLGYKSDDLTGLTAAIGKFNDDMEIHLIVTAGGLAAYQAAKSVAAKPFVSLVGDVPTDPLDNVFLGGVSLESLNANVDRITHLTDKHHHVDHICLFYNPNSRMRDAELQKWPTTAAPPVPGGNDSSGHNDSSTYQADFAKIGATTVTAVVISADPFFQDTMDDLIDAANDWVSVPNTDRYVVYPVMEYENKDGTPSPAGGKSTLLGPDLRKAYDKLGQQAANAIKTGTKVNFLRTDDDKKEIPLPPT